ncbi:hypothetical protein LCGC14_0889900 [marine sediment metagenome]|uniref:Uncharacterized protein n=1 Tax=marine sediment metagenome TaxID=412755 RepID=A0A0F9PKD2_9ZZZZ
MRFKACGHWVEVKLSSDGKYLAEIPRQLWDIAREMFFVPYLSRSENGFIYFRAGPITVMGWPTAEEKK